MDTAPIVFRHFPCRQEHVVAVYKYRSSAILLNIRQGNLSSDNILPEVRLLIHYSPFYVTNVLA